MSAMPCPGIDCDRSQGAGQHSAAEKAGSEHRLYWMWFRASVFMIGPDILDYVDVVPVPNL
jgi:hypothetical protein